jgi:mannosyltransferase
VLAGALLRFATLDLQSYRYDEAVTAARILQPNLFDTLSVIPNSESAPPLYYLLAWFWSQLFGTGEVGLRSLSALLGTAAIPVVFASATALGMRRRVGLLAAALVALNPVLIWFSQDARAYSLAFLLTALSFLFFALALRQPRPRWLAGWALAAALALATHYFTGFVLLPEAALLLWCSPRRRQVAIACAGVALAAALLAPIALHQADNAHAGWIAEQPLSERLERAGAKLVGADNGEEHNTRPTIPIPLALPAGLALLALLSLAFLATPGERRAARPAALVAAASVLAPLILALLGSDYFNGRNMTPAFGPLMLLLAAGFCVRRAAPAGPLLALGFCLCSLAYAIEVDRLPRLQREDLRNAAEAAGPPRPDRVVVAGRYVSNQPLRYYLGAELAERPLPPLREIVLIGSAAAAERSARRLLPPRFRQVESRPVSYEFTLTRFRASRPARVPLRVLEQGGLVGAGSASVLFWPAAGADASAAASGGASPLVSGDVSPLASAAASSDAASRPGARRSFSASAPVPGR